MSHGPSPRRTSRPLAVAGVLAFVSGIVATTFLLRRDAPLSPPDGPAEPPTAHAPLDEGLDAHAVPPVGPAEEPPVANARRGRGPLGAEGSETRRPGPTPEEIARKAAAERLVRGFLDMGESIAGADLSALAADPYLNPNGVSLDESGAAALRELLRPSAEDRVRLERVFFEAEDATLAGLEAAGRFEVVAAGPTWQPPAPYGRVSRSVKREWGRDGASARVEVTDASGRRAFAVAKSEFEGYFRPHEQRIALPALACERVRDFFFEFGR